MIYYYIKYKPNNTLTKAFFFGFYKNVSYILYLDLEQHMQFQLLLLNICYEK